MSRKNEQTRRASSPWRSQESASTKPANHVTEAAPILRREYPGPLPTRFDIGALESYPHRADVTAGHASTAVGDTASAEAGVVLVYSVERWNGGPGKGGPGKGGRGRYRIVSVDGSGYPDHRGPVD
ncbi:hypothetical protein RHA1_ro10453 (plasmid) [Rhodococcus jostii RHA1]|uniref:Uncharacterized protein n=1 Tax=Rhodococcus jostii (strain RHA1) TaxID=101510 RepID=Q0RVP4_RHOJR|nr:hypothetical protein RHA1_ro10453 [Rhodococcus jostii RHA1]